MTTYHCPKCQKSILVPTDTPLNIAMVLGYTRMVRKFMADHAECQSEELPMEIRDAVLWRLPRGCEAITTAPRDDSSGQEVKHEG